MATTKTIQVSFAGGEIGTSMYGRKDDLKYQNGLAKCENLISLPQGPVTMRPGFEFVQECGKMDKPVRLIPFVYNTEQTMVIELGDRYARFHSFGATLINDEDQPYQIETPWKGEDLFELSFAQSGDIMTIVHRDYAPREIRRYGARDWRVVEIVFNTTLKTPTGVRAVRITEAQDDPNKDKYTFKYRVSSLNADKSEESEASEIASVVANIYQYGTTVKISCNKVPGAKFYRFYRCVGGLYGYIGDSEEPEIIDDNIAPKLDVTNRRLDTPFENENYPATVGYFEQRRCFAGLAKDPQRIVMTRSATESQLSYSLPTRDDDRISFRIASREFNQIQHIVPLSQLILLTSGNEFRVSPLNTDAITPSSISARPLSNNGSATVRPLTVNNSVIYAASRGGHLREMTYQYASGGYVSNDICLRATHLFDFKTIKDAAASQAPVPVLWFVSSDGSLLGLTYIPEQEICSWHKHTTDGVFESVAVIPEGDEDHLYCVIRREVNGQSVRYIERSSSLQIDRLEDAFFMDAGAKYVGSSPVTRIERLDWLEGKTVSILADGAVCRPQVVKNASIQLEAPAKVVHIGLPFNADVQTLPLTIQEPAMGSGRMKNVSRVAIRVFKSSGLRVGPSFSDKDLVEHKHRRAESLGTPPDWITGEIECPIYSQWTEDGTFCIRQSDPLPLTVEALVITVAL